MHSVVVFGDVRTHIIECRFAPGAIHDLGVRLYGGTYFMSAAVDKAIKSLPKTAVRPKLFSFDRPDPNETDRLYGDVLQWELSHYEQADERKPLRLRGPYKPAADRLAVHPKLSTDLLTILRDGKAFEDIEGSPFPMCPDIIVFDDLDLQLRRTKIVGDPDRTQLRGEESDTDFQLALSLLVKRLKEPGAPETPQGFPGIEPVILCSVMNQLPELRAKSDTIWDELVTDPWLRDRTVVLMDAADLRDPHHLAISTGLSWERTAQDSVVALHRSQSLRPFLQFGQLIVRFGVTGALHIVRRHGDWSYTLYFDPAQDDVKWTDPVQDGGVLGATSVYMATFVRSLTRVCNDRDGKPLLPDLAVAIGNALPAAIRRCQFLTYSSYGTCRAELERLYGDAWIPPGIFEGDVPRSQAAKHWTDTMAATLAISRVEVPPLQMRNWSIVNQSAQIRMGEIANMIVRFGPDVVLNQPLLAHVRNRHSLVEDLGQSIMQMFDNLNVRSSQLSSDDVAKKLDSVRERMLESHWVFGTRPFDWRKDVIAHVFREPQTTMIEDAWKRIVEAVIEAWSRIAGSVDDNKISEAPPDDIRKQREEAHLSLLRELLKQLPATISEMDYDQLGSVATPFVRFGETGQTLIIDRREVEGFRAIQKLIKSHLNLAAGDKARRPLSLAVFGPPGSGKSTAVRSIVDSSRKGMDTKDFTFNLAQFTRSDDLTEAFHQVTRAIADRKIPIVFFDEFDAEFENSQLGWLKFFLAPMEDGSYRGERVKDAVFVFAGGTAETFAEFSHENRSRTDEQWLKFSKAKGPDFVSRLGGYVNIVGINPADPDDEVYLIRRAILIRSILSKQQNLKSGEPARIDDDMLRAMLHVPVFRHGGRSVRMLLDLCTSNTNKISKSSVPPIHQLNMLVDGKAFLDLVANISRISGPGDRVN